MLSKQKEVVSKLQSRAAHTGSPGPDPRAALAIIAGFFVSQLGTNSKFALLTEGWVQILANGTYRELPAKWLPVCDVVRLELWVGSTLFRLDK
jgi:hypothetical protein